MSSESSSDSSGSSTSGSSVSTSSSSSTRLDSGDNLETSSTTSARIRKKRGYTKCKVLEKGGPRRLTFDKNGIAQSPVKHANQFSSYCGHIARMRVDIRIKDWRLVPDAVKTNLWEDVSQKFILPKDKKLKNNVRRATLKIMGHAWKDFKWKLNLHYVKKEKTPFQDYPTLKEEWWPGFVEWVTSDEYIALGEKGKKSQSKHEFRQRLGRRSYAVQKKQWAKEDAQALSEGKSVPFQDMPDGRHKDWARARNPSGDAKITESHPIIKKIVDLNAKSVAGTFTPADNMDILATALGSNDPGRTTGVSAYVGLGMGLAEGDASRKKKRTGTKELVKKLEEEYNAKFAELRAMCETMQRRFNNGAESCSSSKFIDPPEHTAHHSVDSIQEVTKCKLVVHIGPQSVVVARGQAFPPKDVQTVHGIERRDEHTRVQETTVHTNPQNLARASPPLPDILANQDKIPTQTVGANTMDVTPSASNDSKKRKHKHKKHKDKKNKKHSISKPMNTEDDDGLDPLWNPPLRQRSPSPIPVDKEFVLGQPFTSSALIKKMGKQSQRFHKWYLAMTTLRPRRQLATHFMVRYMRKIDKYRGVVGFLDPEMVLQRRIAQEADEVGAYIVKALLAQQDKECIFVVCQEGLDRDRYPQGRIGFATSPLLPEEIANVRERLLDFFMTEDLADAEDLTQDEPIRAIRLGKQEPTNAIITTTTSLARSSTRWHAQLTPSQDDRLIRSAGHGSQQGGAIPTVHIHLPALLCEALQGATHWFPGATALVFPRGK
ncbi:hypothetical protein U9M48_042978 [Paspalum notatum var. saurae]|uniref:DUF8039 domain-containing protein n=1 Tax=Paspalum notatum var. saurae TaxID=547442 RepID=A0AAQ3US70_PASNO